MGAELSTAVRAAESEELTSPEAPIVGSWTCDGGTKKNRICTLGSISGISLMECGHSETSCWCGVRSFLEVVKVAQELEICLLNPCNVVAQWSHHSLVQ